MDESYEGGYDIILGSDLLTYMGLDLKFSESIKVGGGGPYEGCLKYMVDLGKYNFKYLTEKIVKLEESFIKSYINR